MFFINKLDCLKGKMDYMPGASKLGKLSGFRIGIVTFPL